MLSGQSDSEHKMPMIFCNLFTHNVDFVSSSSTSSKDVNGIEKLLVDVNPHVNTSKTEYMTVQKSENER